MFYYFLNLKIVGKYIALSNEYILLFRLIIYVRYSFTYTFSTFYIGLFFTCTLVWMNVLSTSAYTNM